VTLSGDVGTYGTGVFDTTNHGHVVAVAKTQTAFEKMAGKYGATASPVPYIVMFSLARAWRMKFETTRPSNGCLQPRRQVRREGGRRWDGKHGWSSGSCRALAQRIDAVASRGYNAHVGPVCVEDSNDAHACAVLTIELEAQRLADALALVIACSDAGAAHMTPVSLWLRMHVRIAIYLKQRH
jgi:hypothetical protein